LTPPYSALGRLFGLVALPPLFLLCLAGILVLYILSAEMAKRWFYLRQSLTQT
jgi:Mg2+-importing ATPase